MIYCIVGPTCSGKTQIGLELAKKINGEIISADSRQIYKYLSVGTAKPYGNWEKLNGTSRYIVEGIPYHLVDFKSPKSVFSAGAFVLNCKKLALKIKETNRVPIIVGGTGLYIDSFVNGITQLPARNQKIRTELLKIKNTMGNEYLHKMLSKIDKLSADKIHPNNTQRLIRALEIYQLTGKPASKLHSQQKKTNPNEKFLFFALDYPREILYERINNRVDYMLENGMVEETEKFIQRIKSTNANYEACPALQSLGYRHILDYLNKKNTLDYTRDKIKQDTRNYAKRQLTWFRRNKDIKWLGPSDSGNLALLSRHC